jgi:hypothetical protein
MRKSLAAALLLPALALAQTQSQTSFQTIGYQGQLKKSTGEPERVTTTITFRIYKEAHGGTELWSEEHDITPNAGGFYAIFLGSQKPFPADLFNGEDRYLELQIRGEDPLTPRQQIASVPYALTAKNVNGGSSGTVSTGSVNAGNVKVSGQVTATGGVTGLPVPGGATDAARKDMGGATLNDLGTPSEPRDAATREYVDGKVDGRFPITTNSSNIQLTGPNPPISTGFTNTLTPSNIVKAWAHLTCASGGVRVDEGFNIARALRFPASTIVLDFVTPMATRNYVVVATMEDAGGNIVTYVPTKVENQLVLGQYATSTGARLDFADGHKLSVVVFGTQ